MLNPEEIIESIHARKGAEGYEALAPDKRTVFLVASVDFEVNLGGAEGYLYNSSGDRLPELVGAFRGIGCFRLAEVSRRLKVALENDGVFPSRSIRHKAMNASGIGLTKVILEFEDAIQN